MAANTETLSLKKPSQEDFYNVEDFNENFQKIDDFANRKDNPHAVTAEQVGTLPCYRSLASIGLTGAVTTEQVCEALPVWSRLLIPVSVSEITDLPADWGTLEITRADPNFCVARFTKSLFGSLESYMGRYSTLSNALWSGWYKLNVTAV